MTNCVMGFAHGPDYNWGAMSPFVRSIREKARFDGDVVLFTKLPGMDVSSSAKLKEYGITEISVDLSYVPEGQGFMLARFWQQEKTLRENPQWERVLLVDTRDMIFQSDMERFFQDDKLHLQQESIDILTDIHFNSLGVLQSWGQSVLDEIGHRPVLNSGSIWGGREVVINLLNQMHSCGAHANCDQHALMYLTYKQNLPSTQHENNGGYIWTIAMTDITGCKFDDGLIYMADGNLPPVVHQYDRFTELKSKVQEYYK